MKSLFYPQRSMSGASFNLPLCPNAQHSSIITITSEHKTETKINKNFKDNIKVIPIAAAVFFIIALFCGVSMYRRTQRDKDEFTHTSSRTEILTTEPPSSHTTNTRKPSVKIIGGRDSLPHEFPYQVSLQRFNYETDEWDAICGGSIINNVTIVSAAHCICMMCDSRSFRVVAGEIDLSVLNKSTTKQISAVERSVVHDGWDEFTNINDLVLIFLAIPFNYTEYVQPIRLPPQNHTVPPNETTIVTGWGGGGQEVHNHQILQKVSVPVTEKQLCRDLFGDDFKHGMICAGVLEGNRDACPGDSGGPLVAKDLGHPYLAGIVSWGYMGCGEPGTLGFYTDVASYVSWINSQLANSHPFKLNTLFF